MNPILIPNERKKKKKKSFLKPRFFHQMFHVSVLCFRDLSFSCTLSPVPLPCKQKHQQWEVISIDTTGVDCWKWLWGACREVTGGRRHCGGGLGDDGGGGGGRRREDVGVEAAHWLRVEVVVVHWVQWHHCIWKHSSLCWGVVVALHVGSSCCWGA